MKDKNVMLKNEMKLDTTDVPLIMIGADPELFVKGPAGEIQRRAAETKYQTYVNTVGMYNKEFQKEVVPHTFERYCEIFPKVLLKPFISAHNLIPGTKKEPFQVRRGAIQVDGVALEFNIEPARNEKEWMSNLETVLEELKAQVNNPEIEFIFSPTATFLQEYWDTQIPEFNKILGCEPDYNAYTLEANPKPETKEPFRTASGHVHVSWREDGDAQDAQHFNDCALLAQQLDMCLGVMSTEWDTDTKRRELYGKPGAFRPKAYGLEYRSLSNAWLNSNFLRQKVYRLAYGATVLMFKGEFFPGLFPDLAEQCKNGSFSNAFYQDNTYNLRQKLRGYGLID